jgi:hypothetical protein
MVMMMMMMTTKVNTMAVMEATEVVMEAMEPGEVTEAAMEVTEEVIPEDLEAKPHGVCPEVCVEE